MKSIRFKGIEVPFDTIRSSADRAWAEFRVTHPELYSDAIKQSGFWPYLAPVKVSAVK